MELPKLHMPHIPKPGERSGNILVTIFQASTPILLLVAFNYAMSHGSSQQDLAGAGTQPQRDAYIPTGAVALEQLPANCVGGTYTVGEDVANAFRALLTESVKRGISFDEIDLADVNVTVQGIRGTFSAPYPAFTSDNPDQIPVINGDEVCVEW